MNVIFRHPKAFLFALGLHLLLAFFLVQNLWSFEPKPKPIDLSASSEKVVEIDVVEPKESKQIEPLKTFAVDKAQVDKHIQAIKAEEQRKREEQQVLAELAKQNKAQLADLKKKQEAEKRLLEQARKDAEIARLQTEAEKKRAAEERKQAEEAQKLAKEAEKKKLADEARLKEVQRLKAEAEKVAKEKEQAAKVAEALAKREEAKKKELEAENQRLAAEALQQRLIAEQEEEAALAKRLAEEAEAKLRAERKQKEMANLRDTYKSAISAKVRENYRTPADISPQAQCEIEITQTPTRMVASVKVEKCNSHASDQFIKAAESAVLRAQPFPEPPLEELFERKVRFIFKP